LGNHSLPNLCGLAVAECHGRCDGLTAGCLPLSIAPPPQPSPGGVDRATAQACPGRGGGAHPGRVRPLPGPRRGSLRRPQTHPRPRGARLHGVTARSTSFRVPRLSPSKASDHSTSGAPRLPNSSKIHSTTLLGSAPSATSLRAKLNAETASSADPDLTHAIRSTRSTASCPNRLRHDQNASANTFPAVEEPSLSLGIGRYVLSLSRSIQGMALGKSKKLLG
jgi:hypothetical protein